MLFVNFSWLGFAPFSADTPEAVFDNINNWEEYVPYMIDTYIRPNFSEATTDLIQQYVRNKTLPCCIN